MGFMKNIMKANNDLLSGLQKSVSNYQEDKANKKAAEEARQQSIIDGNIKPIQVTVSLESGEHAYIELAAKRVAIVDKVIEQTTHKSKKKGTLSRALVGGVLLGPLGAVGGAASAGSKGSSTTLQQNVSNLETIDEGALLLTNKRLLFIGQEIVSLPYDQLIAVSFAKTKMSVKYAGMLKDEQYIVSGEGAKDTELYYKGITGNLLADGMKG